MHTIHLNKIRTVKLRGCSLTNINQIARLASSCEILDISRNNLCKQHMAPLIEFLKSPKSIVKELNLDGNSVED